MCALDCVNSKGDRVGVAWTVQAYPSSWTCISSLVEPVVTFCPFTRRLPSAATHPVTLSDSCLVSLSSRLIHSSFVVLAATVYCFVHSLYRMSITRLAFVSIRCLRPANRRAARTPYLDHFFYFSGSYTYMIPLTLFVRQGMHTLHTHC